VNTTATQYIWATGRRKTAIARVRLRPGTGNIIVNDRAAEEFFCTVADRLTVKAPLELCSLDKKFDVLARVNGGGPAGQAGAVRHGISRAICKVDLKLAKMLRDAGFLTRDARMKERKKYGHKGARASFQFSKR
jgi:small subunit ribosomal protein S9